MGTPCEKFSGVAFGFHHSAPWSFPVDPTFGHLRNATCSLKGFPPGALELVEAGPRALTPQRSPYWEGVGPVVLRACGGCHASSNGSLESSLQSKGRGGASLGPGDLNVTTFGFLSILSSLVDFRDLGTDSLLGFLVPRPLKLGLWTGLLVRSSAWSLNLAGCMKCS